MPQIPYMNIISSYMEICKSTGNCKNRLASYDRGAGQPSLRTFRFAPRVDPASRATTQAKCSVPLGTEAQAGKTKATLSKYSIARSAAREFAVYINSNAGGLIN